MTPMAASLIAPMASSLIQPVSLLINAIPRKGVMRVAKEQEGWFLSLLALPLKIKTIFGEGVRRTGNECNNTDHMNKIF